MNARMRWAVGMTALAAALASAVGICAFMILDSVRGSVWDGFRDLWLFVAPPAILAASISAWWWLRRAHFVRREPLLQALAVTGLAFVLYFFALAPWFVAYAWLNSDGEGLTFDPGELGALLAVVAFLTSYAALLGGLPALMIEYRVMRAMRRRWPISAEGAPAGGAGA